MTQLADDRFTLEPGYRVRVEIPTADEAAVREAIIAAYPLTYGDYDRVTFSSAPGSQRYRPTGSPVTARREETSEVICVDLSFFLPADDGVLEAVLRAIYASHPYEEPVIEFYPTTRTRHRPGVDADNPNKHWNRK